jgi:hypothetical protein
VIRPPSRLREFTLGLIYDSIGWTPHATPELQALRRAIGIAKKSELTEKDFTEVRLLLMEAGFHTAPQPQGPRCKDGD